MTKNTAPEWARNLTEDDEWVVRTALANVAHDLLEVAGSEPTADGGVALTEIAARYQRTLDRIESA